MFTHKIDDDTYLKLLDVEDEEPMFELTDSSRDYLRNWLPWVDKTTSSIDSGMFIETAKKKYVENNGMDVGIWYQGEMAGMIGFHNVDWLNKKTDIGYWVGESFQGHGLVTKACRVLMDYAFRSWKLNRVEIHCGVGNEKSSAIPKRLGFTKEGTLREVEKVNDRMVSHDVYGMLKSEWLGEE